MACCNPIEIFYNVKLQQNQIKYTLDCEKKPILVDCGKCPACQTKFTTQLGLRAMHELSGHVESMFITLTVNDLMIDRVFPEFALNHRPFQLFMKRFRKWLSKHHPDVKVRYLMAGEYGAKGGRPHYHAVIYGFRFKDLTFWRQAKNYTTFRSAVLEKLWGEKIYSPAQGKKVFHSYGYSEVGQVNMKSCTYLAKYVAKGRAKTIEDYTNQFTGEVIKKEYLVYPSGEDGGLGYSYYKKHAKEFFKKGYFLLPRARGKDPVRIGIPRYYQKKFKEEFYEEWEEYSQRLASIVQTKEEKYIQTRLIEKPKKSEIDVYVMCGYTEEQAREEIYRIARKEVQPYDVYTMKMEDGYKRRIHLESRADNTRD